jgi:hypothetical protein
MKNSKFIRRIIVETYTDTELEKIDYKIHASNNKSAIIIWEKRLRTILRNLGKIPKLVSGQHGSGRDHEKIWNQIEQLSTAHKNDILEWGYDIINKFNLK